MKGVEEMNKPIVPQLLKSAQKGLIKNGPGLLTGLGVGSLLAAGVLAVKVTPKALADIEAEKEKRKVKPTDEPVNLTAVETIKVAGKHYIVPIAMAVGGTSCIIGANSIQAGRQAALVTLCQTSTTALNEFRSAAVDTVGEEKVKEIRDKIVEKKQERDEKDSDKRSRVCLPDSVNALFWEPISNQYLRSSKNAIGESVNYLNGRMIDGQEMYMSFDEFLDELNLKHMPVMGSDIGWSVDRRIDICFTLDESDRGEPCWKIDYIQPPEHGYSSYY